MRAGLVVSIIGHVGAVLMTMLVWEARSSLPTGGVAVVPVEIVDIAEESNVRALRTDEAEEEASAQEEETTPEETQPAPTPAPGQRRPQPRQQEENFDVADASDFIDRQRERNNRNREGETSDRNQEGVGRGTAETASLEARIASLSRQALERCWRTVADLPDPQRLRVVVAIRLNRDGSLNGQPRVISPTNYTFDPLMAEAVNRALRAVRTCDPITRLPEDPIVGEAYDLWREQEVTFGLRQ
ncbi:MAG TPA: cell envelope integrity protein TolA [Vitreimonas sp.]|uniref:cell envelope integrity protein TolA n=1 Tax=Vitreimonas sp. TaxID=3069702 RepID=UPI002D65541A|nr:cell envelope integrity protein TolA [Vitreimonas sp.]HYD88196.1 cell envelope integrity protein TolA [Vitreimonas sp.]